jgi:protein disulfide-isomerase A1
LFSNSNEESIDAEAAFSKAANANKGKVLFSISKPDDGFGYFDRLAEYIGVKTDKLPALMLVKSGPELSKFSYEQSTITVETLTTFVDDYLNGKVS